MQSVAQYVCGTLQCVDCFVVYLTYTIHLLPHVVTGAREAGGSFWRLRVIAVLLADTKLIFLLVLFVASVLGMLVSPYFFAVHLLDMINKSPDVCRLEARTLH